MDFAVSIGEVPSTPLGPVWVGVSPRGLAAVLVPGTQSEFTSLLHRRGWQTVHLDEGKTAAVREQLSEYFAGVRRQFDFPIDWSGMTPFQQEVLRLTFAIPYGQTRTYGELARQVRRPHAARAVGRAQATNPMPLVIPCHRVLGADGSLRGYGAGQGVDTKAWLLEMERTA